MILKAENISKSFGKRTLFKNISFTFEKGILLIIGKSGCGKSTLLKILMNQLNPDEGKVTYDKENVIFSNVNHSSLSPYLSYEENKTFLNKTIDTKTEKELKDILSFNYEKKKLYQLSGGERQKAELIFALSKQSDIYFLDEPISALDKESKEKFLSYLIEFSKEHPIVLISHDELVKELDCSVKISFDENNNVNLSQKEIKENNSPNEYKIKYKSNIKNTFKYIFSNHRSYEIIKVFLNILTFVFFSLGCSFVNTKTRNQNYQISLNTNPYTDFQINVDQDEELNPTFFEYTGMQSLTIKVKYDKYNYFLIELIGSQSIDDSTFLYYTPKDSFNVVDKNNTIKTIDDKEYNLKEISIDEIPLDCPSFEQKSTKEYLFVSNSFIDQILLNNTSYIKDFSSVYTILSLPDFKLQNDNLIYVSPYEQNYRGSKILNSKEYILKGKTNNQKISLYDSYKSRKETLNISYDDSENLTISLNRYKDLLLHSASNTDSYNAEYSMYFKKDVLLNVLDTEDIRPINVIPYLSDTTSLIIYFSLSFVSFLFFIFFVLYTKKTNKSNLETLRNIYSSNQYKGMEESYCLINIIENFSCWIISFALYVSLFIPLADKRIEVYSFPLGYKSFNEAYKNISTIEFMTFENIIFCSIAIFIILSCISNLVVKKKRK